MFTGQEAVYWSADAQAVTQSYMEVVDKSGQDALQAFAVEKHTEMAEYKKVYLLRVSQ